MSHSSLLARHALARNLTDLCQSVRSGNSDSDIVFGLVSDGMPDWQRLIPDKNWALAQIEYAFDAVINKWKAAKVSRAHLGRLLSIDGLVFLGVPEGAVGGRAVQLSHEAHHPAERACPDG